MKALKVLICMTALAAMQCLVQASPNQVAVVQTPAKAIDYRELKGFVMIDFKGTVLIPEAQGAAEIRNKAGTIGIKARFENLASPSKFGREYLTYVFWAISPDGRATNLGELILKDGKSSLKAATPLQALSLIVTAEPYFAVSQPGSVVVIENVIRKGTTAKIVAIVAKHELLAEGQYTLHTSQSDVPMVMDKKTPFVVYQARNAVAIAKEAGAESYAPAEFKKSLYLLEKSELHKGSQKNRNMTAREAVQSAEASRLIAVKAKAEESLAAERRLSEDRIASAQNKASIATKGQAKAEAAQTSAEIAQAKSESERVKALNLAQDAVASSAASQADAKSARADAAQSKGEAANERANSANAKMQAENEKAALRAQLFAQFNLILQTRDTARGLIVNMSDVLFQTGSNKLRPQVREKLSKLAGIVLAYPGLKLEMEGHTDNIGGDTYNQTLSEGRAQAVRDYLVSQGVVSGSIVSRGFGKTKPIDTNDSNEGRQKNRRVEMVVTGSTIGS